jgi:hypothetical protein
MSEQPRLLYHYTSIDAFRSIVDSGKMRATRFDQMNDESELQIGLKRLLEAVNGYQVGPHEVEFKQRLLELIDKSIVEPKEVYVACFSAAKDSLEQWRAYTPQGGVAIGFDLQKVGEGFLCDITRRVSGQPIGNPTTPDLNNRLSACRYTDRTGYLNLSRTVAERFFKADSYPALLMSQHQLAVEIGIAALIADIYGTICSIKHGAYVHEEEWRSVNYNPNSQDYPVRLSERGKWYIEFPFNPKDYIREVWISPHGDTQAIERVISYFKINNELPFDVQKSTIPFRL